MQKKSLLPLSLLFVSLTAHAEATPSNLRLSLDAGYTFMNYTETHPFQPSLSVVNFQEQAITTNFEVLYYLITAIDNRVSRYEGLLAFMGDLSYTALPLNSNVPSTTAQVLSIDLRLGTVLPILPSPFTLNLLAGYYLTNMSVTNNAFGFTKLAGPELYPILHWTHYTDNAAPWILSAFFKYAPVTDGSTQLNSSNREIAAGMILRVPTRHEFQFLRAGYEKSLTLKMSYADLRHTFVSFRDIQSNYQSGTLTVGYDW